MISRQSERRIERYSKVFSNKKLVYSLTPEIVAAENDDHTSSYSVSFIRRALLEWASVADNRNLVSVELCKVVLISLTKALNMLPPLERPKLVAYLLKIHGNAKVTKACASFINLLSGLISAAEGEDVNSLWKSLDSDPTTDDVQTICLYLASKTYWFKLGDVSRGYSYPLRILKNSLDLVDTKSKGKRGTSKYIFDVKICIEKEEEVGGLKRKREETHSESSKM
jgi:hypothetical protein